MFEYSDKELIDRCLDHIENKLGWGPNQGWTNYDFEKLSEAIEIKTHVLLSVTTLKRICGKVKYDHVPSLTTLNTLAKYIDFEDWRSFKLGSKPPQELMVKETQAYPSVLNGSPASSTVLPSYWSKKSVPFILFLSSIGLIGLYALTSISFKKPIPQIIDPSLYRFEANKILTKGLPNSVVFHYDASASTSDSIYISQTWDISRKKLVDKTKHAHSAIYYYPGYFRAKLIVDSTIVKTHDLQIATDGWLALIENEDQPIYFKKQEFEKSGSVEINELTLNQYHLNLMPVTPKIRFFNQGDLGDLRNDNFTFETTFKNPHHFGDNSCQYMQVLIQCKDDIIIVPLSAKACVGNLRLVVAGARIESSDADLSGFGTDLMEWTHLKIVSKNKVVQFFINGNKAYELKFPHDPTEIVGVQYRFNGLGAIKNTFFVNGEKKWVL